MLSNVGVYDVVVVRFVVNWKSSYLLHLRVNSGFFSNRHLVYHKSTRDTPDWRYCSDDYRNCLGQCDSMGMDFPCNAQMPVVTGTSIMFKCNVLVTPVGYPIKLSLSFELKCGILPDCMIPLALEFVFFQWKCYHWSNTHYPINDTSTGNEFAYSLISVPQLEFRSRSRENHVNLSDLVPSNSAYAAGNLFAYISTRTYMNRLDLYAE